MADEPEDDIEEEGEEKPKGKLAGKKKLIVIAAAALLLIGGGAAAFFMMGGEDEPAAETADADAAPDSAAVKPLEAAYFELPSLLVNLSTDGSRSTYLRVAATLELANVVDVADARQKSSAIMDGFQTFLREMRPSDIAGSGGLVRLKEELLVRANAAMGRDAVQNVLLTEFLVQ